MIRSTRKVAYAGDVEMLELRMSNDRPGFRDSILYVVGVLGVEPRRLIMKPPRAPTW